jgi:hypothetical protein
MDLTLVRCRIAYGSPAGPYRTDQTDARRHDRPNREAASPTEEQAMQQQLGIIFYYFR